MAGDTGHVAFGCRDSHVCFVWNTWATVSSMSRHNSSKNSIKTRKSHDQAIAGLVAGSATVALLHPLDVIKTRLQVQDGTGPVPATKGMVDMGRKLWSSGGLRSLYAGTCAV